MTVQTKLVNKRRTNEEYQIDNRWRDIGLSDQEIKHVMFLCKKFVNQRDLLDDIVQTAIIALLETFQKYIYAKKEIYNRNKFIGKVVRCKLIQEYINNNRRDLLYNTSSLEDDEYVVDASYTTTNIAEEWDEYVEELTFLIDNYISDNIDKYIAYGYYILKMTQSDIGDAIGVHQTRIFEKLKYISKQLEVGFKELKGDDLDVML